jgi:NAD(P)-dependent dehydrogenase (short-subunit alcohol dehydrogenase family)
MDHIALVTGADRGLGFALSKGLLERGWHVFAGQYMPEWPELAALASQFPGRLDIVSLDVSSIESARAAAQAVSQRTDHIDLLISNAGIGLLFARPRGRPAQSGPLRRRSAGHARLAGP